MSQSEPQPGTRGAAGPDDGAPPFRYSARLAGEIESRWQEWWTANGTFDSPNPAGSLAAGFGQQAENAVGHAESGAEDRHERDLPGEHLAGGALERRLYRLGCGGPVACDLVDHQPGDLVEQLAEFAMIRGEIAKLRQLRLDNRVRQNDNVWRHRTHLSIPAALA